MIAALITGGRGLQAGESLRANDLDAEVLGLETGLATKGTVYNALCDMVGLKRRKFDEVYVEAGPSHPSLDLLDDIKKKPRRRRTVPAEPEAKTGITSRRPTSTATNSRMRSRRLTMRCGPTSGPMRNGVGRRRG